MKRILLIMLAISTIIFNSCGVGTYSVSSGNEDKAAIYFTSEQKYDIKVEIDGIEYPTTTIKQRSYKAKRKIKAISNNQIYINPGRHKVVISKDGIEIYNHEIFVSSTEIKRIEL